MASEDGSAYRMDPAEMLWDCSIRVICAGEDVVVDITTTAGAAPITRLADRTAPRTPERYAARQSAA